ncbi:LAETG motif-containing sortase-dependent surface protein [Kitasatospora sp. NPDC097605]|uniref:LAETG motif-containing sortase-dependent surface protein n=1 Tax=Kitasatospora sp. NPDC097605 TaxID=3157226 RepID=UPI003331CF41
MRTTVSDRRNRSRRAATTVLATVLAGGTVLLSAPAALADDDVPTAKLTVDAPAVIGLAGQPVEFTETVTNTSSMDSGFHLFLKAVTGDGLPPTDGIAIDYRDPADGAWKSIPLWTDGQGSATAYRGDVSYTLQIPAHRSVNVQLRIGLPMGQPHNGAGNGGIQSLALESAVAIGAHGVATEEVTDTIKVDGLTTGLSGVPATAVAGGAPIEFDAVLKNPTASNYVNVANVLGIDPHATVEVRTADGGWTALTPVQGGGVDDGPGVYLEGRDSSVQADSTTKLRVRMSYDAATPLGPVTVNPCVFVNENPARPFSGTTACAQRATVQIVAPAASASKAQPPVNEASAGKGAPAVKGASTGKEAPAGRAAAPVVAAVPAAPAAPAAPVASAEAPAAPAVPAPVAAAPATVELASTGSTEQTPSYAAAGVALLAVGGGAAFWVVRRRRA